MIDQQDLKRIRRALEDKESPRVYGEDRGGRMITLLVLKVVDFGDSSQLLLRETRTGRYRTLDVEIGKWNSATLIQDTLFTKKRAKAGKARWKEKKENEASEILMVRNTASYEWEGFTPMVPFLKKAVAREEVGFDFWLVHDLEQSCWYVIDEPTGLVVTRAETRSKAKENFDLIRPKALQAREGKGYEEAKKRLLRLQDRPIWGPKNESEEDFAKRLAGWEKSYMEEDE